MAIELNLTRPNHDTPWGFRLTGGADYDVPLIVTKVFPDSIAAKEGLEEEDIVVRINNTPTAGLSHIECHDLLIASGNNLILAIRRGDVEDLYPHYAKGEYELIDNIEDVNQTNGIDEYHKAELQIPPKKLFYRVTDLPDYSSSLTPPRRDTPSVSDNSELESVAKEVKTKPHKWSTFLQKPENPLPYDKIEATKAQNTYKVVIQKQKKKKKYPFSSEDKEEEHQQVNQEEKTDSEINNNETSDIQELEQLKELPESDEQINDEETLSQNEETQDNLENEESRASETREGSPYKVESQETQEPLSKTLEEQLAEVQQQLQFLSQLPTSIQDTLEAVTKQLAEIVKAKKEQENDQDEDNQSSVDNTHTENDITEPDMSIASISNPDETVNGDIQENEEKTEGDEEADDEQQREDFIEEKVEEPDNNKEPELTEEEKEAIRMEEEMREKREKEEEYIQCRLKQRPTQALKPKPIERPIILPGGRRWSQPDDVIPILRKPKMSDEKISQTIETYSEVISGKLKGINFQKYQPPPKNLDYLQRSEVYRLVHDMEPPIKGIGNRMEKVLAEEDYYRPRNIELS